MWVFNFGNLFTFKWQAQVRLRRESAYGVVNEREIPGMCRRAFSVFIKISRGPLTENKVGPLSGGISRASAQ